MIWDPCVLTSSDLIDLSLDHSVALPKAVFDDFREANSHIWCALFSGKTKIADKLDHLHPNHVALHYDVCWNAFVKLSFRILVWLLTSSYIRMSAKVDPPCDALFGKAAVRKLLSIFSMFPSLWSLLCPQNVLRNYSIEGDKLDRVRV